MRQGGGNQVGRIEVVLKDVPARLEVPDEYIQVGKHVRNQRGEVTGIMVDPDVSAIDIPLGTVTVSASTDPSVDVAFAKGF